jgi:hypothetical protein
MKKTIKFVLCIVSLLSVLFCFGACDSGDAKPTERVPVVKEYMIGRYELQSIEWSNGTVATDKTLQEAEDAMGDMYVELFRDSTAQLSLYGQINDMEFSEDQMWQIDFEDNSYEFSVKNGKVTLEKAGDTYIFVKE